MKNVITLCLLLLAAKISEAQFVYGSIPLTLHKKPEHIKRLPFDKTIVLDNRFDSTNFLIDETKPYLPEMDAFSMPASKEISAYIDKATASFPKERRLLYINLKQLRFGNLLPLSRTLFFAADAYIANGKGLTKVYAERKTYSFSRSFNHTIVTAINHFIEGLAGTYYSQSKRDTNVYALEQVNENVMHEWVSYPIMQQTPAPDGAYRSSDDFRQNKIVPVDSFAMMMNPDSSYRLSYVPESSYKSQNHYLLLNSWALSYKGDFYISVMGKYFVPMHRLNNSFSFHIPDSLPDMYNVINPGAISADYNGSGGCCNLNGLTIGNGNNANAWEAVLIGFAVIAVVAITVRIVEAARESKHHEVKKAEPKPVGYGMKSKTLRNCFLDMDTGDIIYH